MWTPKEAHMSQILTYILKNSILSQPCGWPMNAWSIHIAFPQKFSVWYFFQIMYPEISSEP